jgi:hypothetical protein
MVRDGLQEDYGARRRSPSDLIGANERRPTPAGQDAALQIDPKREAWRVTPGCVFACPASASGSKCG